MSQDGKKKGSSIPSNNNNKKATKNSTAPLNSSEDKTPQPIKFSGDVLSELTKTITSDEFKKRIETPLQQSAPQASTTFPPPPDFMLQKPLPSNSVTGNLLSQGRSLNQSAIISTAPNRPPPRPPRDSSTPRLDNRGAHTPPPILSSSSGSAIQTSTQTKPRVMLNREILSKSVQIVKIEENANFFAANKNNNSNSEPNKVTPVPVIGNTSELTEKKEEKIIKNRKMTITDLPIANTKGTIKILQLEGTDNVHWKEFETRFEDAKKTEPEEFHDLFDLSSYDFEIVTREPHVSKKQFLEKLLEDKRLNAFSRECVSCFLNNWVIVKGSLFDRSLDKGSTSATRRILLPTLNVEKNVKKDNSSDKIQLKKTEEEIKNTENKKETKYDPDLYNKSTTDSITDLQEATKKNLPKRLFNAKHEDLTESNNPATARLSNSYLEIAQPFSFEKGRRLLIECIELSFSCGIEEPYYCSLALHDIKQKQKLSESFHFHLNKDEFCKLFDDKSNHFASTRRCFVPITNQFRENIYIIIRVDKLYSGDFDREINRYSKKANKKDKQTHPMDYWMELGLQRQPFVWAALPLYDDQKKIITGSISIDEFHPFRNVSSDDFIYEQLNKEIDVGKKTKTILGNMVLIFDALPVLPPNTVDPSLNIIEDPSSPIPISPRFTDNALAVSRDLEWFGITNNEPYLSYVNNLYIYPQNIFLKHPSPSIALKIELRENENSKPLNVIYMNWGSSNFTTAGYTAATYKEKRPCFGEEIKIQLPGVLSETHHILFTLLNLPNKDVLGYAYCPIFSNNHGIIKNSKKIAAIEPELPSNYLSQEVEPIKITETKKSYICFESRIISSLYPESNALFSLSHVFQRNNEQDGQLEVKLDSTTNQVLEVIQRLPHSLCIAFFPPILNLLLKILVCGSDTVASLSFICIISVLKKVREVGAEKNTTCNSLLLTYVRFLFSPAKSTKRTSDGEEITVHDVLAKQWVEFIEAKRPEVKDMDQGDMWILLNILLKSMILKLCEDGLPPASNARLTKFSNSFTSNLEQLVLSLFCVAKEIRNMDVLTMVPLFMKDLLGIINRGIVFEMMYCYICWLNSENHSGDLFLATVKFTFIKIITDYKYYIPLNLPHEIVLTGTDPTDIVQKFWTEHFFAGLIVREVRAGLLQKQRIREQSVGTLRNLLQTHDMDERFQGNIVKKQRITGLYFPFIITTIEFRQLVEEYLEVEEKVNWLLCFFYIIHNCSKQLLHQWWNSCSAEKRVDFFVILEMATVIFKRQIYHNPISSIIIHTTLDFVILYTNELQEANSIVLPHIFNVLKNLQYTNSTEMAQCLFHLFSILTNLCSKTLFLTPNGNNYCGILALQVLYHCNFDNDSVSNSACSLFNYLLQKNYEETGDIKRMQLQSTIALCRLLSGENKVKEYSNVRKSLQTILLHTKNEKNETLRNMIENGIDQISRLLRFNERLAENDKNPEVMAELFIKIADSYRHSPNLRMTWLEALATHHADDQSWCEAALVHVQLASMIVEYLHKANMKPPVALKAFKPIFPEIDINMLPNDIEYVPEDYVNFAVDEFIIHIEKAINLIKQDKQYELAIELYSLLVQAYTAKRNYTQLTACIMEFNQSVSNLIEANRELRIFSKFFRVAFYGKAYGEENGREFIYRCEAKQNLMTIQQYLKSTIGETYGANIEEQIEVIGNKPVDFSALEDDKFYIQVAMVNPYMEDGTAVLTPFQTQFGCDKFLFESASGSESKKKTIFKTKYKFPHITTRIEIIETKEILLSPLESAIDLINDRINKFKAELNVNSHNEVRVNQLQQLLQGSVVPMVNEGPFKICDTFLSKEERGNYPKDHIQQLEASMSEFIKVCGFGVKLVNQVIELRQLREYEQFQSMIETQYNEMRKKILTQFITAQPTEQINQIL